MVLLDAKYFDGGGDISADIAKKIVTVGLNDTLNRTLTELGWEGQLVGVVGLSVAPDGKRVTNAEFAVRGELAEQPFSVQVSKWWDCDMDISVDFTSLRGEEFKFCDGNMVSNYVNQDMLNCVVKKQGRVMDEQELEQLGQFSVRLVAHLDKTSNGRGGPTFKLTVLVFPKSAEQMESIEGADSASWPGIKIVDAKASLFPSARLGAWGAPLYPLVITGDRAANSGKLPPGEVLRFCMGKLLGSAIVPTACTNRVGLARKWQQMAEQDPAVYQKQPAVQWPIPPEPDQNMGE
jgi:hypothetical protein